MASRSEDHCSLSSEPKIIVKVVEAVVVFVVVAVARSNLQVVATRASGFICMPKQLELFFFSAPCGLPDTSSHRQVEYLNNVELLTRVVVAAA